MKLNGKQALSIFSTTIIGLFIIVAILLVPVFHRGSKAQAIYYIGNGEYKYRCYKLVKFPSASRGIKYVKLPCYNAIKAPNGSRGIKYIKVPELL